MYILLSCIIIKEKQIDVIFPTSVAGKIGELSHDENYPICMYVLAV